MARFSADFYTEEKAEAFAKTLQESGAKDIRIRIGTNEHGITLYTVLGN